MIGDALRSFARMLGVKDEHAEDALHSEHVAHHVTRRGFLGAAAALAGGSVFSFGPAGTIDSYEFRLVAYPALVIVNPLTALRFGAMLKERYSDVAIDRLCPVGSLFVLPQAARRWEAPVAGTLQPEERRALKRAYLDARSEDSPPR